MDVRFSLYLIKYLILKISLRLTHHRETSIFFSFKIELKPGRQLKTTLRVVYAFAISNAVVNTVVHLSKIRSRSIYFLKLQCIEHFDDSYRVLNEVNGSSA